MSYCLFFLFPLNLSAISNQLKRVIVFLEIWSGYSFFVIALRVDKIILITEIKKRKVYLHYSKQILEFFLKLVKSINIKEFLSMTENIP